MTSHKRQLIVPAKNWSLPDLRDLIVYRELLVMLVIRDYQVRYRQTVVGVGWALIQPLMMMIVFSLIFGSVAKLPSEGVPYPIFAYTALLPWNLFANVLSQSSQSLTANQALVTKTYCPRLVVFFASSGTAYVDFVIASSVLVLLFFYYGLGIGVSVFFTVFFLILGVMTVYGVGLWISVFHARYRDFGYIVPFIAQAWMWASPIAYSATVIPERWQFVYFLNPIAGAVQGIRWSVLGSSVEPNWYGMGFSVLIALAILVGGLLIFRKFEQDLVDVL